MYKFLATLWLLVQSGVVVIANLNNKTSEHIQSVGANKGEHISFESIQSQRGIGLMFDDKDIIKPKESLMEIKLAHSHKPPMTGPHDLSVNTTTPTSIKLQWQLDEYMKDKILKYRIHYVHQNFHDVKTTESSVDGLYDLSDLGKWEMVKK